MNYTDSPLQAAKERLPIPALWQILNLPGKPGRECYCPFHDNRNSPAASVFQRGGETFFNCFGGCVDKAVDSAGFLALHLRASNEEACRKLIEMADTIPAASLRQPSSECRKDDEARIKARKRAAWPVFDCLTDSEIEALAALRGLTPRGVRLAAWDGLLRCADSQEGRTWIVTDNARRNAQGRLMSGKLWAAGMKSKTLPGAEASWPIGLPVLHLACSCVALVEGGPDLLAAYDLAARMGLQDIVAPVAMLGAGNRIPDDALRHFAGKRVRIFWHDDEAGEKALARWGQQLTEAGIDADGYSFAGLVQADGKPVKDLNDFARMRPETLREYAAGAFAFALRGPRKASNQKAIPAPAQKGVKAQKGK